MFPRVGAALAVLAATACNVAQSRELELDGAARQQSGDVATLEAPSDDGWGLSRTALLAKWNALRGDAYELDVVERVLDAPKAAFDCPEDGLVQYSGTAIRYHGAVKVNASFRARLERFEHVAVEVATEIYGRAPRRVRHYGAFSCRTSRNRSYRLSEHALGNALDVVGFDFGPASKQQIAEHGIPRELRGWLQVRVARHWGKTGGVAMTAHARFLRELTERLLERGDVFRGFVGPGHPGHDDHLHFDMSPWRYVRL